MTNQTKPLFCPKCKGELLINSNAPTAIQITQTGAAGEALFPCYWCRNCLNQRGLQGRLYFIEDCLTEEQLADQKAWLESLKVPIRPRFEKLVTCCLRPESMCECKQTPSFCFAEGEDGNKLHEVTPLLNKVSPLVNEVSHVDDINAIEWINFSDRKPEVGQEIEFLVRDDGTYIGVYAGIVGAYGNYSAAILRGGTKVYNFYKWKPVHRKVYTNLCTKCKEPLSAAGFCFNNCDSKSPLIR